MIADSKSHIVVFVVLTAVVAACSHSPSAPSPDRSPGIPVDQLSGTWNLVSLQQLPEPELAAPVGTAYTVTFTPNQFSMRGECNRCTGGFVLTGGTLSTGPFLACTIVACEETPFDSRYKALLLGNTTVALSATTLELSSLRGVLRFKK